MLLTLLLMLAAICFVSHVIMLFTSFPAEGMRKSRYFMSHVTLWLTGIFFYLVTGIYAGEGISAAIDLFDTNGKRMLILVVVFGLSLLAHIIVRLLVIPQYKNR
jgi:uncharacterized membrane protein HdeD (DUF308 family)